MRLLNIRTDHGERVGVRVGEQVLDIQRGAAKLGVECGSDIRGFLGRPDWRELAQRVAAREDAELATPREEVEVGAIVPNPQKVIFCGGNTHSHLKEAEPYTHAEPPQRPMLAPKFANAVTGPYDQIVRPAGTSSMDYEAELCVVIGARARHVAERDAASVIAGYSVANDISDREFQLSSWEGNSFYRTHFVGKSFDGFCPCGPELVTAEEVEDRESLRVSCRVNGELKQEEPLSDLYFSVEQVVSYISFGMTLEPGDLVLMGSPAGVAHFLKPPPYLGPGDVVRCEVESIGFVESEVVEDPEGDFEGSSVIGAG